MMKSKPVTKLVEEFLLLAFQVGAVRLPGLEGFGISSSVSAFTDLFLYPGKPPYVRYCGWVLPLVEAVKRRREEGLLSDEDYKALLENNWLAFMGQSVSEEMILSGLDEVTLDQLQAEGSAVVMIEARPSEEEGLPVARGRLEVFRKTKDIARRGDPVKYEGRAKSILTGDMDVGAVVRILPMYPPPYKVLMLPEELAQAIARGVAQGDGGLYLFSGLMGAGKTTTIASLVARVGDHSPVHIAVLEDREEYIIRPSRGILFHREIGKGRACSSYEEALDDLLRAAVDLVVVGEVRNKETMERVLTLAETGVMVFCTVHAPSARETFYRILGMFTGVGRREEILCRLGGVVKLVNHQALVRSSEGRTERLIPLSQLFIMDKEVARKMEEGDEKVLGAAIDSRLHFFKGPKPVKGLSRSAGYSVIRG